MSLRDLPLACRVREGAEKDIVFSLDPRAHDEPPARVSGPIGAHSPSPDGNRGAMSRLFSGIGASASPRATTPAATFPLRGPCRSLHRLRSSPISRAVEGDDDTGAQDSDAALMAALEAARSQALSGGWSGEPAETGATPNPPAPPAAAYSSPPPAAPREDDILPDSLEDAVDRAALASRRTRLHRAPPLPPPDDPPRIRRPSAARPRPPSAGPDPRRSPANS